MANALDRRRRRWVPIDVDLLAGDGRDVYERFGHAGISCWVGFLTACHKSSTPGQMRWRDETEAMVLMGLNGYRLVDNLGKTFTIEEFFAWTGRRRWTTATRRRGATDPHLTRARRWDDWQPRAHRLTSERTDPQANSHEKGADRAQEGRKKGNKRAPTVPNLTVPSTSPKERGGGGEGTARESESADSTPAGSADSTSREPATPENNGPPVPAEASAAIAALRAAAGRPPTTRPTTADTEAGS